MTLILSTITIRDLKEYVYLETYEEHRIIYKDLYRSADRHLGRTSLEMVYVNTTQFRNLVYSNSDMLGTLRSQKWLRKTTFLAYLDLYLST